MGADTYLRLFERLNTSFWPWHVTTLFIGVIVFLLVLGGREKLAWPLLGSMWALVGVQFHGQFFVELNWAAVYFGWGFIAQGALLSLLLFRSERNTARHSDRLRRWLGAVVIGFSVLGFPFLSPIFNRSWYQAEVFGVAPDPTCLFTLGIMLMSKHRAWWLMPLPILWCVLSAAIAYALYLPSGLILAGFGFLFLILSMTRKKPQKWFVS